MVGSFGRGVYSCVVVVVGVVGVVVRMWFRRCVVLLGGGLLGGGCLRLYYLSLCFLDGRVLYLVEVKK